MQQQDWNSDSLSSLVKIIKDICIEVLKEQGVPCYVPAIVQEVHSDGTVDVYLPPNRENTATRKLNKTGETLHIGDSVELLCKKGRLADSWVAVKHSK